MPRIKPAFGLRNLGRAEPLLPEERAAFERLSAALFGHPYVSEPTPGCEPSRSQLYNPSLVKSPTFVDRIVERIEVLRGLYRMKRPTTGQQRAALAELVGSTNRRDYTDTLRRLDSFTRGLLYDYLSEDDELVGGMQQLYALPTAQVVRAASHLLEELPENQPGRPRKEVFPDLARHVIRVLRRYGRRHGAAWRVVSTEDGKNPNPTLWLVALGIRVIRGQQVAPDFPNFTELPTEYESARKYVKEALGEARETRENVLPRSRPSSL